MIRESLIIRDIPSLIGNETKEISLELRKVWKSTNELLKNEWKRFSLIKCYLISCFSDGYFIPYLYAGFFLKLTGSLDGSTDELSVAVVNEDQSVDYEGKKLASASELIE